MLGDNDIGWYESPFKCFLEFAGPFIIVTIQALERPESDKNWSLGDPQVILLNLFGGLSLGGVITWVPIHSFLSLQWGIFVYLIPINCYWSQLWFLTIVVILCISVVHFYQHKLMIGYRFCRSVNKTYKKHCLQGKYGLKIVQF